MRLVYGAIAPVTIATLGFPHTLSTPLLATLLNFALPAS
jgi:hypothetical protein